MVGDGEVRPFLICVCTPPERRFSEIEPFLMSLAVIVPSLICLPVMSEAAVAEAALTTSAVMQTSRMERDVPLLANERVRAAKPRSLGTRMERNPWSIELKRVGSPAHSRDLSQARTTWTVVP